MAEITTTQAPSTVDDLVHDWHEAGRPAFKASYDKLDYDSDYYQHKAIEKAKYINLDSGTSGMFMIEKSTGNIFAINAYGVPNRRKYVGRLGQVTGERLLRCQYMKPNMTQAIKADVPGPEIN